MVCRLESLDPLPLSLVQFIERVNAVPAEAVEKDVAAVLGKYANAPLVSPTRAVWWGPVGTYTNA